MLIDLETQEYRAPVKVRSIEVSRIIVVLAAYNEEQKMGGLLRKIADQANERRFLSK